ncbi:MAG: ATP-binding protein, partial [Hyphomicrobiaceae bacterium]
WTFIDLTQERERAVVQRRELETELAAFKNMPAGLFWLGSNGRIEFVNSTLLDWLGYTSHVDGTPDRAREIISRADVELLSVALKAGNDSWKTLAIDFIHRDGRVWPASCRVRHVAAEKAGFDHEDEASGQFSEEGMARLQVIAFPQTPTLAMTGPIPGTSSADSVMFQMAPFGVAIVNNSGGLMCANRTFERLVPNGPPQVNHHVLDSFGTSVTPAIRAEFASALKLAGDGIGEISAIDFTAEAEKQLSRRVHVRPIVGADDDSSSAVVYLTDTTEEASLAQRFAQSQKMEAVGKLAGGIAHDFNNVLTAIIGFSDLLLASHRPADLAFKNIQNIRNSANHAAELVRQLLAFSRRQTLEPEVLQLNELVTDLSVILNRVLGDTIELKIASGRGLWSVRADRSQLSQVIINLAVNARDAMANGGRLTIRSRNVSERDCRRLNHEGLSVGQYVVVEVEDTGIGMEPDVVEKIFEPFFTTKDIGKGTGLGLSTVYGIVKQTGGSIMVDSMPGEGTIFRVFLPRHLAVESDPPAVKLVKETPKSDLTGHGRVLIVEDEESVRQFAVQALRRQGYEVLQACDGIDALEVMRENHYEVDLVISDVKMPEMDGPTLFQELRSSRPDLKFIFVSGYADADFKELLAPDADFVFLAKPYSLAQIAEVTKSLLSGASTPSRTPQGPSPDAPTESPSSSVSSAAVS